MINEFQKIQKLTNKVDKLLLKGLGLMLILILVAGLNSYGSTPVDPSKLETEKNKSENIDYSNCITSKKIDYQKPDPILKTNTSKSIIDLITDTDTAGVAKGEIIALEKSEFITLEKADDCLNPDELVYIFIYDQTVKIYPKSLLRHHQVIHDSIDKLNLLVTYSPFSDSANIYTREDETFGISGRVYKGNNLIYDKKTESLWLDINGKAVIGDMTGKKLTKLILRQSTYTRAKQAFPNAEVLSLDNGYNINYNTNPYSNFEKTSLPFGNVDTTDYQTDAKEKGISFEVNNKSYFFAFEEIPSLLTQANEFKLYKNEQLDSYEVGINDPQGNMQTIPYTYSYYYSYKEVQGDV